MFIGIDIGGYKINSALVKNNKIIKKCRVLIKSKSNKKIIITQIFDCIENLTLGINKKRIKGIGVGVPGPIDFRKQKVLNPPNMTGLKNIFLGKIIQEKFKIKTKIDNDVNCFTLAEAVMGVGENKKIVIGLTLGTGVGGGIVVDKKIFHGASGSAGEFGQMVIHDKRLEFYKKNNRYLGIGLANIVNILNPDIIVIGGGIVSDKKFKLGQIKKTMKKYIWSSSAKNTKVVKAKFGEDTGAIGATLLF